jgi:hypothetical protein
MFCNTAQRTSSTKKIQPCTREESIQSRYFACVLTVTCTSRQHLLLYHQQNKRITRKTHPILVQASITDRMCTTFSSTSILLVLHVANIQCLRQKRHRLYIAPLRASMPIGMLKRFVHRCQKFLFRLDHSLTVCRRLLVD